MGVSSSSKLQYVCMRQPFVSHMNIFLLCCNLGLGDLNPWQKIDAQQYCDALPWQSSMCKTTERIRQN